MPHFDEMKFGFERIELRFFERYRHVIAYLFFGACTTAVNIGSYWLAARPLNMAVMPATVLAWVLAVLFAYVTNRFWVFHSAARTGAEVLREAASFFACRLASGGVDWACMYVFAELLRLPDLAIKILANVLVMILNFVASKWIIFRQNTTPEA